MHRLDLAPSRATVAAGTSASGSIKNAVVRLPMRLWADLHCDDCLVSSQRGIHGLDRAIPDDSRTHVAVWWKLCGRFVRYVPDLLPSFHKPQECPALQPDVDARAYRIDILLSAHFDSRALAALGPNNGRVVGNGGPAEYREQRLVEAGRRLLKR